MGNNTESNVMQLGESASAPRLIGGVSLDHPDANGRARGEPSRATLTVDRRLKTGRLDVVELSEDDLLRLIETAAKALRVLRGTP